MLPEVAADVLRFLSRRDLDKASAVSKWLVAMIVQCCDAYPLRPVHEVAFASNWQRFTLDVTIAERQYSRTHQSFSCMDDLARFVGPIIRHSYVEHLRVGDTKLLPGHWTTLIDAIRRGAVRNLEFDRVVFSALEVDAFLVATGSPGLQSIGVRQVVVPSGFVTDALIRAGAANGVRQVCVCGIYCDSPHSPSEDAVLDFFFRADDAREGQGLSLKLHGIGITDLFLSKFFERLLSSTVRPSGRLKLYDAVRQRGLSAYARYLAPDDVPLTDAVYRFPSVDDDESHYEVVLCEDYWYMSIQTRRSVP